MASGMEFLIKSLGIDPEEIKTSVRGFAELLIRFDKRQEEMLSIIAEQDRKIAKLLDYYEPRDLADAMPDRATFGDNDKAGAIRALPFPVGNDRGQDDDS